MKTRLYLIAVLCLSFASASAGYAQSNHTLNVPRADFAASLVRDKITGNVGFALHTNPTLPATFTLAGPDKGTLFLRLSAATKAKKATVQFSTVNGPRDSIDTQKFAVSGGAKVDFAKAQTFTLEDTLERTINSQPPLVGAEVFVITAKPFFDLAADGKPAFAIKVLDLGDLDKNRKPTEKDGLTIAVTVVE